MSGKAAYAEDKLDPGNSMTEAMYLELDAQPGPSRSSRARTRMLIEPSSAP